MNGNNTVTISVDEYFELRQKAEMNMTIVRELEANQIKGRCKDCKYVIRDTCHGKISDDFVCGDGWTKADGYCDEWEPKEDDHGRDENDQAAHMADEGPGEAGTEPV